MNSATTLAGQTDAATSRSLNGVVSHPALVAVAAKWLQRRCAIVLTELSTTGETPDAIGWQGTHSRLVECKISRADFLADGQKSFRQNQWQGIGCQRYYLTTPGIIKVEELPAKWGLLELTGKGIRVVRESEYFDETNHRHEVGILLSTIRRIGQTAPTGCSIKAYYLTTKNNATLSLEVANDQAQAQPPEGDSRRSK